MAGQLDEGGTLMEGESGKTARYLQNLEEALNQCAWSEVPELCRKVQKHAPQRNLLVLAERSEVEVINFLHQRSSIDHSSTQTSVVSTLISPLREALENQNTPQFDKSRATIILGWIHWVLNEPELALERLSTVDLTAISDKELWSRDTGDKNNRTLIQGFVLKGTAQESINSPHEAIRTYTAALPYLSQYLSSVSESTATQKSPRSHSTQCHRWTEQLLSRLCGLLSQRIQDLPSQEQSKALEAFRLWAKFWNYRPKPGMVDTVETGIVSGVKRRDVWKAYYDVLSVILRANSFSPSTTNMGPKAGGNRSEFDSIAEYRSAQRAELKRIEACYETLLLDETTFPKASQRNEEVERWVDAVIANWRIFCGQQWQETELGEGGKSAVGKGVLDILYRAATKTFHSTQILRYLFTVHSSLAEFNLAFKAFQSYVELVKKGKAREQKSGQRQPDLDSDAMVILTMADAIQNLCKYGGREEVEKALETSQTLEEWLSDFDAIPQTKYVAHRAIGISQAHWARMTFDNTTRTKVQEQGLHQMRKATEAGFLSENNLKTIFSLSLLYGETRDVQSAVTLLKDALEASSTVEQNFAFERERQLCSVWHLLALLMSTKSDFDAAERLCNAAFDQFGSPSALFGQAEEHEQEQPSENGNVAEKDFVHDKQAHPTRGIVDQMEFGEKEGLVQIKITQLALREVMDGPLAAIEFSGELLGLYGRLFGDPTRSSMAISQTPSTAPQSSAGTTRNFGSILGRPKSSRRKLERHSTGTDRPKTASITSRPSTSTTGPPPIAPPMIQVINEDGSTSENSTSHRHSHLPFRKGNQNQNANSGDSTRPKSYPSWMIGNESDSAKTSDPEKGVVLPKEESTMDTSLRNGSEAAGRPDQPLPVIAHNMTPRTEPPPVGHIDQPPEQDTRLPTAPPGIIQYVPAPRFTIVQEQRQKTSLLVKVWLFIAGLYTRAVLRDDAQGAIDEAQKLVEGLESQVSLDASSSRAFSEHGWGLGQSVDELWADVFAERGALAEASSSPHEALTHYEQALAYFPDHATAIISLSGILLDIYSRKIAFEPNDPAYTANITSSTNLEASLGASSTASPPVSLSTGDESHEQSTKTRKVREVGHSPEDLNRIAARDRAYNLLSTLTKLGTGWDSSEAWSMLARAYEESGQIEKAKEVLWWCVELEDSRPLRHWRNIGTGGFVL
ncbi:MAG: hypothetical protein M1820_000021 [Bogoriella megaspora]|nr:MAG: hypothetical protein M1820_000021 [Bogoriella megaspora]